MTFTSIAKESNKAYVSKKNLRSTRLNIKIHQMTEQEAHAFWERRNARQEEATRKHNERRKESDKQMVELQELYDSIKSPLLKKKVDALLFCFNDCFIKWTYNHRKRLRALLYVVKSELQKEQDALKQMEKILG